MKQKIIAIVGASGSGKTYASLYAKNFGIDNIVSYTTRPIREGETDGVEHWFVKSKDMPPRNQMLAFTKFGSYHYWALKSQVPKDKTCVYVVDEVGLIELIQCYSKDYNIVTVLIKRDQENLNEIETERKERDNSRIELSESLYNYIVDNNGTLEEFEESLDRIFKKHKQNEY